MAPCLQTRNQSVVVEWSNKIVDVGAIITLQFYNNCTLFFLCVNWLIHVLPLMYQTLLLANGAYHIKLE